MLNGNINPFHSGYCKQVLWQSSEDPDEMPHNAIFHNGLHYLPG